MQTVPGGRQPIVGGVRTKNDRGGADVSGETKGAGRLQGLREGYGGRVAGIPPDDTAWEGEGGKVELEQISHKRRRNTNLLDRVPDQGRYKGMPSGGLPRKDWDTDGDEDAFLSQACPGHRDHIGGGKPPTPKVLTMRYAGPVTGHQWETSGDRDVQEWGVEEETATGRDRAAGKHRDGLRGLRETTRGGTNFQVPGANNDGRGRRLVSGGRKPGEGTEELGTAEADTEQVRGGQENIGKFFQGGSSTGAAVWGGDVGVDSNNREGVGLVHAWGRKTDHGETAAERVGWKMVLPLPGEVHEGSRIYGNQDVDH